MTPMEKVKLYAAKMRMSQTDLCKKTGLPSSRMSHLFSGKVKKPTMATLQCFADALGVDIFSLLNESDEDLKPAPQTPSPAPSTQGGEFCSVPMAYAKLAAGDGRLVYKDGSASSYHFRSEWLHRVCSPAAAALFEVEGASMEPTIYDGGVVMVDTSDKEFKDGRIFAIRIGDYVRIKRLFQAMDGRIRISSDNPAFQDEYIRQDELEIIGRAFWQASAIR